MKAHCTKGLKEFALVDAAKIGKFAYYYSCGMVIHQAIENVFAKQKKAEHSAYVIWNRFRTEIEHGKAVGQSTFLTIANDVTNSHISTKIEQFISGKHDDAETFFIDFMNNSAN